MQRIYKLKGVVQPYAWGGKEFIPSLTGMSAGTDQPAAEYWLGAHPSAPSIVDIEGQPTLADLIRENKQDFLGINSAGSLSFLVKLLDVREMLSIQVHPLKEAALKGYEKENAAGISLTAANRNYKDANQKEEMMVALSDFWLLHGFRTTQSLQDVFSIPELSSLSAYFEKGGYEMLYTTIMRMPQAEVNETLKPLAERVTLLYNQGQLSKKQPDYWAAKALQKYFTDGNIDRGVFSIYLLNLLHLGKGEAMYQPPGILHAYLQGQNAEVMSNSDNVLRAGLTNKHVDMEELLSHVSFEATQPDIKPSATISTYSYNDFQVGHYHVALEEYVTDAPAILLVIEGPVTVYSGNKPLTLQNGEAVFVLPATGIRVEAGVDCDYFLVVGKNKG